MDTKHKTYTNYRDLILDYKESNGLSYREFSSNVNNVVSSSSLSSLLKKDRSNNFAPGKMIELGNLFDLLCEMNIKGPLLTEMLLLRAKEELELKADNPRKASILLKNAINKINKTNLQNGGFFQSTLDKIPLKFKTPVYKECYRQLEYYLLSSPSKAKNKGLLKDKKNLALMIKNLTE